MRSIPDSISTDAGPPVWIPFAHFVVGLCFLLAGGLAAVLLATGDAPVFGRITAAHLLLVGWITVTIMGAMIQFVPVWSGVQLYSRTLAIAQLGLVAVGVIGFAGTFFVGLPSLGVGFVVLMFAGLFAFVYTAGRTLLRARPWDVTESHFAIALGFFLLAALLGTSLGFDYWLELYPIVGVLQPDAVGAHVSVAVFGGVVTTVIGALYQLAPMFTQSEPTDVDLRLRRIETVVFPPGVFLLGAGRLFGVSSIATIGGLAVALGVAIASLYLLRRLQTATVEYSPMLPRYLVAGGFGLLWSIAAALAWVADPLAYHLWFGPVGTGPALLFGTIGFVVVGTLYHVIPFLIWVRGYSDRIGYEPVPMIDDLYDARLARLDLAATAIGALLLIVAMAVPIDLPLAVPALLVVAGVGVFVANMVRTVASHAPQAIDVRPISIARKDG